MCFTKSSISNKIWTQIRAYSSEGVYTTVSCFSGYFILDTDGDPLAAAKQKPGLRRELSMSSLNSGPRDTEERATRYREIMVMRSLIMTYQDTAKTIQPRQANQAAIKRQLPETAVSQQTD